MKDNIHYLPPHTNMTVGQAFGTASRANLKEVIIIGYDEDGDFILNSSHMSRAEALFILEKAKLHTMGIE